jgi:hypothetical protein
MSQVGFDHCCSPVKIFVNEVNGALLISDSSSLREIGASLPRRLVFVNEVNGAADH